MKPPAPSKAPATPATHWLAAADRGCRWLTFAILGLLGVTVLLRWGDVLLPDWWNRLAMPILCSGAVGYFTNYVAIRMLFEPYSAQEWHWLRLLFWNQGLVPKRKDQLAESIGREIAGRLLTPEVIAQELSGVVGGLLDDETWRGEVRYVLGPILREHLPAVVDRLTPEILSLLREGVAAGFQRDKLKEFVERVVEPWLHAPANRERLVEKVVAFLRRQSPQVVQYLRESAERYKRRGFWKTAMLNLAEFTGGLNWAEVQAALDEQLGSRENREQIVDLLADLGASMRTAAADSELDPVLHGLQDRSSDFLGRLVEEFLQAKLPEAGNRLADTPAFWRWLADEGLPQMKPHITHWLEHHAVAVIGQRFDVVGRVRSAIAQMDVRTLHQMADRVAAEQLGAIQVLGFILGLAVGIPLVLVL